MLCGSYRHEVKSCADPGPQSEIPTLLGPVILPAFGEVSEDGIACVHVTAHFDGLCEGAREENTRKSYSKALVKPRNLTSNVVCCRET